MMLLRSMRLSTARGGASAVVRSYATKTSSSVAAAAAGCSSGREIRLGPPDNGASSVLPPSSSSYVAPTVAVSGAIPPTSSSFSSSLASSLSSSKRRLFSSSAALLSSSSAFGDGDDGAMTMGGATMPLDKLWNPTEEHTVLRSMLRGFVQKEIEPQAEHHNRDEIFNVELFRKLGTCTDDGLGLLGLTVDEEYGGTGFRDAAAVCAVHEEMCYSDPAFCLSYLAHSLLLVNNLSVNASHEQKQKFLPDVCSGMKIGGMCMSEPNAGTDVLGMQTNAVRDETKRGWILNGTKMWITNGTITGEGTGDLFLVYARTGPDKTDITQFVVEKDMEGFALGQKITDKLGMRASMTAELVFDNVYLPDENVVGDVNGATLCMMRNLEIERLGLAAMALGIARRSLDEMKKYALQRGAFGQKSLTQFGQIQRLLSESYAEYMAGKSYVYAAANALDLTTSGNGLDADGTKLFCAKMSKDVADRAVQVMGGYGYVGEYKVERLWRDAKLLEIGGGTNESHHKNMTRDLVKMGDDPLP